MSVQHHLQMHERLSLPNVDPIVTKHSPDSGSSCNQNRKIPLFPKSSELPSCHLECVSKMSDAHNSLSGSTVHSYTQKSPGGSM